MLGAAALVVTIERQVCTWLLQNPKVKVRDQRKGDLPWPQGPLSRGGVQVPRGQGISWLQSMASRRFALVLTSL